MDHLNILKAWINQYLNILINKEQSNKNPLKFFTQILTNLIVNIKQLFKSQSGIDIALFEFYVEELYCIDQKQCQNKQHPFIKIVAKQKQLIIKSVQIFIRITIMGLSLKIPSAFKKANQSKIDIWKKNFTKFYNSCQLQMSFLGQNDQISQQQTQFVSLLLKFLYSIQKQFQILQFYENIKKIFLKLEADPIIKWSNNAINKLLLKLQKKQQKQKQFNNEKSIKNLKNIQKQTFKSIKGKCQNIDYKQKNITQQSDGSALRQALKSLKKQKTYSRRTIYQQRRKIFRTSLDKQSSSIYFQESFDLQTTQQYNQPVNFRKKQSKKQNKRINKNILNQQETKFFVNQTPPKKKRKAQKS